MQHFRSFRSPQLCWGFNRLDQLSMFCSEGKPMGAPTGNRLYDSARDLSEVGAAGIIYYGMSNPYAYSKETRSPLPDETGIVVQGSAGVPMVPDGNLPAASSPMSNPAMIVPPAQPALPGGSGVGKGGSKSGFAYKNNPMDNPKAARDIVENPDAVYGYSPNPESTRIGEFASKIDWTDPDQVAIAQQTRQKYHEANEAKLQALYNQGYTTEEIATRMVEERNMSRINSYIKNGDLKGLEIMKKSNLKTYGNELGMTLEQALEKNGSYEEIINATIRSNPGMDACTGLYDIYHGGE